MLMLIVLIIPIPRDVDVNSIDADSDGKIVDDVLNDSVIGSRLCRIFLYCSYDITM